MIAVSMLKDPFTVDPDKWTPLHTKLDQRAASYPEVERIFVHPAIKKVLCEQAGNDRSWLAKVRPWWNHYYHFHVRVSCVPGASDCEGQKPASGDDGCGQELADWFAKLKRQRLPELRSRRRAQASRAGLLPWRSFRKNAAQCLPLAASSLSLLMQRACRLRALASKKSGPPPPSLTPHLAALTTRPSHSIANAIRTADITRRSGREYGCGRSADLKSIRFRWGKRLIQPFVSSACRRKPLSSQLRPGELGSNRNALRTF